MLRMSKALKFYVIERLQNDPIWKGLRIVYSDASIPGEGEHKILDFIRGQRNKEGYNPNMSHLIYGADADLIMLGLSTHEPTFYIIREVFIPPYQRTCGWCGRQGHDSENCDALQRDKRDAKVEEQVLF